MRQHAIEHPLYVRVVSTLVYRLYMYLLCYVFSCIIFPCRYANHGWSRLSIYHSGHGLVCSTRVRIRVVSYTTTIPLSVAASHAFAKPCEPHPLCTTVVCCTLFTSLDVHFINVYLSYSKHWLPIATFAWTLGLPPPSSMFCLAMWVVVVGRLDVGCVRVVLCIVYLYLTDVSFL